MEIKPVRKGECGNFPCYQIPQGVKPDMQHTDMGWTKSVATKDGIVFELDAKAIGTQGFYVDDEQLLAAGYCNVEKLLKKLANVFGENKSDEIRAILYGVE